MANTLIQLKFSTVTATPTSLNVAEPAYSYTSNTFFIGSPAGTGSIAIGGKFYLDQQQAIYNLTNAAFSAANSAGSSAFVQYAAAHANAAFDKANNESGVNTTQNNNITTAQSAADNAFHQANGAFTQANTNAGNITVIEGVNTTQNTNITAAQAKADASFHQANAAYTLANTSAGDITVIQGVNTTQNTNITTAQDTATAAFVRANNSLSANAGGTVTGDVTVTGNLTVTGATTFVDSQIIAAGDSLIKLANNNTVGDAVDIGFYGLYTSGGSKYAGLTRSAGTNEFFLFRDLTTEPTGNVLASGSVTACIS